MRWGVGGGVRAAVGGVHRPRGLQRGAGARRGVRGRARRAGHHAAVPARVLRARARPGRARGAPLAARHLRGLRHARARARAARRAARLPASRRYCRDPWHLTTKIRLIYWERDNRPIIRPIYITIDSFLIVT